MCLNVCVCVSGDQRGLVFRVACLSRTIKTGMMRRTNSYHLIVEILLQCVCVCVSQGGPYELGSGSKPV